MKPTVVEVRPVAGLGWQVHVGKQVPRKAYCFFETAETANQEAAALYRLVRAFWNRTKLGPEPVLALADPSGATP